MKQIIWIISTVIACTVACTAVPPDSRSDSLILSDVHIVDVEAGRILRNRSILIVDGTIIEIASEPGASWPKSTVRPDVAGLYVSPALYDAHAHIFDERDLRLYSTFGVGTIRNMDGWAWHLRLRDGESSLIAPRAHLVSSGSQVQMTSIASLSALRDLLVNEAAQGFQWIKLYDAINREWLEMVRDHARTSSQRVTGHLPHDMPIADVLALGAFDDIAHAEELLRAMRREYGDWRQGVDEVARAMAAHSVALTTTLINNQMIVEQAIDIEANLARPEVKFASPLLQVFWASEYNQYRGMNSPEMAASMSQSYSEMRELVKVLHDRGVVILAGTDAPNPTTVPAVSLHQELAVLVEAGLTPLDALRSATMHAADRLEPGSLKGRVRAGLPAQLILTHDNPLEDITSLRNAAGLVRDGAYATQDVISAERAALVATYEADMAILRHFSPQSAQSVIDVIEAAPERIPISREGLTSLIWVYIKFGNIPEAKRLAELQAQLYPDDEHAEYVAGFVSTL